MASTHNIESQAESAFAALLATTVTGLGLTTSIGLSFDTFMDNQASGDGVFVTCDEAIPYGHQYGNWTAKVSVGVFTESLSDSRTASQQKTTHNTRSNTIREALIQDTLPTQLNSALSDFCAMHYILKAVRTIRTNSHVISSLEVDVVCCGKTMT